MNDHNASKVAKRGRRWLLPVLLLAAFVYLVFAFAPIFPYSLICYENHTQKDLEGPFSRVFLDGFTDGLHKRNVTYIHYNGYLLLQYNGFGEEALNLLIDLHDKESKLVRSLVDEEWGADIEEVPPRIRELAEKSRDPKRGEIQGNNCDLMRAVAIDGW